jgi:hypothetical protein
MKFLVLSLMASTAFAGNLVLLKPPKSPSPYEPGSSPTLCYVTGPSADGSVGGVCKFYGYRGVNQSGLVEWAYDGTPLYLAPCHVPGQYVNVGYTDCPAKVFGTFEYIQTDQGLEPFYLKYLYNGYSVGELDSAPPVPAFVTP